MILLGGGGERTEEEEERGRRREEGGGGGRENNKRNVRFIKKWKIKRYHNNSDKYKNKTLTDLHHARRHSTF
tara:strand:+ start:140 stop:355 length:216 start_codon:yes stop_codon:yes gene_type:complete